MAIDSPKNDFAEKHRWLTYADEPDTVYDGSKIADGTVTTDKLADYAVTTDKIDDESITLSKLDTDVLNLLEGSVKAFDTVADMQAATLTAGDICHTNGFHAIGDGGAAFYKINATGTANGMDVLTCGDVFANLVVTESYVTPEMFGAYGDGVHDDSDIFTQVFQSNYKSIALNKRYLITEEINVESGVSVHGNGVVLDRRTTATFSQYNGVFSGRTVGNVTFDGLTIEGDGTGSPQARKILLYFEETENVTVCNCKFENTNAIWAVMFNRCNHSYVKNSLVDGYSYGGFGNLNGGNDFLVSDSIIINVESTSNETYAIVLNGYDETPVETTYGGVGLSAINNYIYDENPIWEHIDAHGGTDIVVSGNRLVNSKNAIQIFGESARNFYCKNVLISDNVIDGNEDATRATAFGIVAGGENVEIVNNVINNTGRCADTTHETVQGGIYVRDSSNALINGNVISNSYVTGILFNNSSNAKISDNLITNGKTVGNLDSYGIYLPNGSYDDICVERNKITDYDVGFFTPRAFTNENPYLRLKDNTFVNVTTLYSQAAINGLVPQQFTAVPSVFTTARKFDFIWNATPSASSLGWLYNGSTWITVNPS